MKGLLESTDQVRLPGEPVIPVRPRRRRFTPARRRPHGRDARFRGPRLRPAISPAFGVGPARLAALDAPAAPRGCRTTSASRWRLTDRGIAVVLVAGLMIAVAAVTVVTATALRVTSEHYQVSATLQG